jgi:quercetin dioxygenase-like cupin family protein
MKTMSSLVAVAVATGLLMLHGFRIASAQDTLRVNPDSVQLKFENDRVRVLESILPPGGKEKMHSHPSYVVYVIKGGTIRNHFPDGKTVDTELKAGDVIYRDPVTHWGENIGTTEIDEILVELKSLASR